MRLVCLDRLCMHLHVWVIITVVLSEGFGKLPETSLSGLTCALNTILFSQNVQTLNTHVLYWGTHLAFMWCEFNNSQFSLFCNCVMNNFTSACFYNILSAEHDGHQFQCLMHWELHLLSSASGSYWPFLESCIYCACFFLCGSSVQLSEAGYCQVIIGRWRRCHCISLSKQVLVEHQVVYSVTAPCELRRDLLFLPLFILFYT